MRPLRSITLGPTSTSCPASGTVVLLTKLIRENAEATRQVGKRQGKQAFPPTTRTPLSVTASSVRCPAVRANALSVRMVGVSSRRPMDRGSEVREAVAVCIILGGPDGSGNPGIYRALAPPGEFVKADVIARRMSPDDTEGASLSAGRAVLRRLHALVEQRRDFVYATLSSNRASAERRARDAGCEMGLLSVAPASAELNVDRVAQRVSQDGHHIPEDRHTPSLRRGVRQTRAGHPARPHDGDRRQHRAGAGPAPPHHGQRHRGKPPLGPAPARADLRGRCRGAGHRHGSRIQGRPLRMPPDRVAPGLEARKTVRSYPGNRASRERPGLAPSNPWPSRL